MPVSKTKVVKEETIVEKPKEEEEQEFNEKIYDLISEVHHKMDLVLEKLKLLVKNLNPEQAI